MVADQALHPAVERDLGGGEGIVLARGKRALQPPHRLGAHCRDCDRKFGGLVLDGIEPVLVGPRLFEQAVARAQRALQRVDAAGVLGIDREHQPVEKAAALGSWPHEKLIHRRREPYDAQMVGKGRR